MFERLRARYHTASQRIKRFERRELIELRRWIEYTTTLTRLSVLVFVPVLIAIVTWLSNSLGVISFLVFPPLASSTYTLFSDPTGRYSSPWQFVSGLTLGALCGWGALEGSAYIIYHVRPAAFHLGAASAALGIVLTAIVTWTLDIDLPTAYSTALLVLVTNTTQFAYVIFVALTSTLVALVFVGWRKGIYAPRAHYLYRSTKGNDQVLVPLRGETAATTARFGARLAAVHEAGHVVVLKTTTDTIETTDRQAGDESSQTGEHTTETARDETSSWTDDQDASTAQPSPQVEKLTEQLRASIGVACDALVAQNGATLTSQTVRDAVRDTNSNLIVIPYTGEEGTLSPLVRELFRGPTNVIALRTTGTETRWRNVLVPIRTAGPLAHSMIEFASRLAGEVGTVHVCTCIASESQRRRAERMLGNTVETVSCTTETHISQASIEDFLTANDTRYDLIMIGASTDRSKPSRVFSPPTHKRLQELNCDVAVVHQG
jgi:nucleotide-binding universal stress UspA family protein